MYKVLIVDDENIIVRGLQQVVDWEKFGCRVVATAWNAVSGAQAIREHSPDILFTDIRMPDMDGLTMLAGLKSEFPRMQVTVLTGYRDFEYAKRALHIGVTRFLLKPSKMNEIEEALQVMTENLRTLQPPESTPPEPDENAAASSFIVNSALKYIEEHSTEKLTLTELADKIYVSQWYLSKLLNKHTEKSFSDLLNEERIKKAKRLLQDPALRIGDIASMVGFGDVPHFSRMFKKMEGLSPQKYRNSLRL